VGMVHRGKCRDRRVGSGRGNLDAWRTATPLEPQEDVRRRSWVDGQAALVRDAGPGADVLVVLDYS
jgi:hypothetical protein